MPASVRAAMPSSKASTQRREWRYCGVTMVLTSIMMCRRFGLKSSVIRLTCIVLLSMIIISRIPSVVKRPPIEECLCCIGVNFGLQCVMPTCPTYGETTRQHQAGTNPSGTARRECQHCKRTYTPAPKTRSYDLDLRRQALKLYVDGTNFRRIARHLSVNHQTAINWVNQAGRLHIEKTYDKVKHLLLEVADAFLCCRTFCRPA